MFTNTTDRQSFRFRPDHIEGQEIWIVVWNFNGCA